MRPFAHPTGYARRICIAALAQLVIDPSAVARSFLSHVFALRNDEFDTMMLVANLKESAFTHPSLRADWSTALARYWLCLHANCQATRRLG